LAAYTGRTLRTAPGNPARGYEEPATRTGPPTGAPPCNAAPPQQAVHAETRHPAHARGRILSELKRRTVATHALTHAHADHQGSSHAVCEALGLPLWCGEGDAEAVGTGRIRERMPPHPIDSLIGLAFPGPPHPVARRLREGDTVAGFTVLEVPGHSAGHIAFWRESARALICGDVITNMDTITGLPGLHEPKSFFTPRPGA